MKDGFTLVEVLIGLSIATIAAVSVAYTITSTNKVADAGKKTFIATNLAHEGLELRRQMRDNAWLAPGAPANHSDWADAVCNSIGSEEQILNATKFTRAISVNCDKKFNNNPNDPDVIVVTSTVTWQSPIGEPKKVEIQEKLTNWYVAPNI